MDAATEAAIDNWSNQFGQYQVFGASRDVDAERTPLVQVRTRGAKSTFLDAIDAMSVIDAKGEGGGGAISTAGDWGEGYLLGGAGSLGGRMIMATRAGQATAAGVRGAVSATGNLARGGLQSIANGLGKGAKALLDVARKSKRLAKCKTPAGGMPQTYGKLNAEGFTAPKISTNRHGQLTNGRYKLDATGMSPHTTGSLAEGKSQFLYRVNEKELALDAAAYADEAGLWVGSKAKIVFDRPLGVHAGTGQRTTVLNIYRNKNGFIHTSPGTPQ